MADCCFYFRQLLGIRDMLRSCAVVRIDVRLEVLFLLNGSSALISAFIILVVVHDRPEDVGLSLDQSAETSVIPESRSNIFRIPEV